MKKKTKTFFTNIIIERFYLTIIYFHLEKKKFSAKLFDCFIC